MSVILSCGHREDDFDKHHSIMTKESTIDEDGWKKAVGYSTVCLSCFMEYKNNDLILETEEKAMEWLRDGSLD